MAENVDNDIGHEKLGLTISLEFVTPAEEQELLVRLREKSSGNKRKVPGRNSIKRYGSREPYFDNIVSSTIPPHFSALCDRLLAQNFVEVRPDSVTVNEYYAGQIIKAHIDHIEAGPVITILSLASPAIMKFARGDKTFTVNLSPRSLTQMRGPIRYSWTHEIEPVPALRYSLVFRDSSSCQV